MLPRLVRVITADIDIQRTTESNLIVFQNVKFFDLT